MQNRPNNNVAYIVSIVLVTLFFGCTVQQTHKTLVFFFDGVDQVIYHNDYLSHDTLGKIAAAKRDALLKKNRPDMCVHKPYKEKKCGECHTPDKRLLMPMPDLCFKCHTDFKQTNTVVHGPVASGGCLNCHNQHSSKYPKLLIRQGQQICLFCHNSALVFEKKVHREIEDAECTMCHSPHGGKTRYMIKDNIPRDANRIALMSELTYRHLYGQVFCKVPGDVNSLMEIYVVDSRGVIVATAHPDANGKFYLSNLHPDQNYTFRFKKDFPNCRINIMDNNGAVLYLVEKNKKEQYAFDMVAYENVHTAINDAHFLGDTLVSQFAAGNNTSINTDQVVKRDTAITVLAETAKGATSTPVEPETSGKKGKIVVTELPAETKKATEQTNNNTAGSKTEIAGNKKVDTATYKGKIVVKELPGNVSLNKLIDANKATDTGKPEAVKTEDHSAVPVRKSKIVVTSDEGTNSPVSDRFRGMAGATEVVKKFEDNGIKLADLTLQAARYYDGTVVCVLNEAGDLVDLAPVNAKGEFYLYDFLYFRINMPDKKSGIVSQAIFINEQIEVIETINKRLADGRYVYVANSKESGTNKAAVTIFENRQNAVLYSSVYFDEGKATITVSGISELNKVVVYANEHGNSGIYITAHAGSMGTAGFNSQLAEKRAKAVVEYLTGKGIKPERIKVKGKRKNKPGQVIEITPGSEEENQRIRRVDVYIKVD